LKTRAAGAHAGIAQFNLLDSGNRFQRFLVGAQIAGFTGLGLDAEL